MKYLFFIFSLFPQFLWAQYLFDFENDTLGVTELHMNGIWEEVPAGRWECAGEYAISGSYSLHHSYDNDNAGCDYFIITLDPLQDTDSLFLSFRVKHGYPPSSANNWQVAFLADYSKGNDMTIESAQEDILITEGLILGVNFKGSDDLLKLWECQSGDCHELCITSLNYQEQVGINAAPEFQLVWHRNGILNIYFTRNPEEDPVELIGFSQLNNLPEGRHFVIRYEYSSARDRNLWLDEIRLDGNFVRDTSKTIIRNEAEWGDVVFNELMVDPAPAVLLPAIEYLEIYNRSGYELNLEKWRIEVNGRNHILTDQILKPFSYEVITEITMPNDGATLALYSEFGALVHSVRYELPWGGPDWKKEGGWSLESPDPDQVCIISELWEYSSDRTGGTPGGINSNDAIFEDNAPPLFLYQGYGNQPGLFSLHYSEPIRFSETDLHRISVIPGNINPDSGTTTVPVSDQLLLWFPENIYERSRFRLQLPGLADCSGNLSHNMELQSGKSSQIRSGSILINEIMYDPLDGKPEYIELFHPGQDFVDLHDLALDVVSEGTSPVSPVPLSDHSRIYSPGEYLVVTKNMPHLMDAYNLDLSGQWVEVKKMDRMQNSGGTVFLTDRTGSIVDMASYGDHIHLELLDVTQGISLERISVERSGSSPDNWHSAASIEGFSTPGRENSQSVRRSGSSELLMVDPEVFSPDNDGYQDLLQITVSPGVPGWIVKIWVTDLTGKQMRSVANNHLAGPAVDYTWDGELENGKMATSGIYVLHGWGYHPVTGERWNRKKAFGLIFR